MLTGAISGGDHLATGVGTTSRLAVPVAVHVLTLIVDLRLPDAHSLKDKRSIVKTLLDGSRRRFQVAAAETDHQDEWQRAQLGFTAISSSAGHTTDVVDQVDRFVWSFPEVDVLSAERTWLETD